VEGVAWRRFLSLVTIVKKLLAIDGGGIKGVLPAALLAEVEECLGRPVVDYFDLIAGTSTGGILALGLGLGLSAAEILGLYEKLGPLVFGGNRLVRGLQHWGFAKYRPDQLKTALTTWFGERRLGESRVRLVIPSTNLETGEVYIFKTAHVPRFERDFRVRVVDIAMATAAAPTYFPTYWLTTGVPLIDGGVWANNPAGLAVVEAIGVLGWPREEVRVLSLGCSTAPLDVRGARAFPHGKAYWATKTVDVFMAGQSSGALGTAAVLLGHENVVRISPIVPSGRFALDATKGMRSLRGLGMSEARKALPGLRELFFDQPAEPFVPCRTL
jgi:hypothetical protein